MAFEQDYYDCIREEFDMNKKRTRGVSYNIAIDDAAEAAYIAFMETMMSDPSVNREETDEKGKYIQDCILKLKGDETNK